jgi:hypothetical protein
MPRNPPPDLMFFTRIGAVGAKSAQLYFHGACVVQGDRRYCQVELPRGSQPNTPSIKASSGITSQKQGDYRNDYGRQG